MNQIWKKKNSPVLNKLIEAYTIGNDYILDMDLLPFDIGASKVHAEMLNQIGIVDTGELKVLTSGLDKILRLHKSGKFKIDKETEDCHSAIEFFLTENYGEVGKKIHAGRSRNDQILVTMRLFSKAKINDISIQTQSLINVFNSQIKKFKGLKMPGYTHMQRAMPSSMSMWLESFKESLEDDLRLLQLVLKIIDQNPLGSCAGFGENILGLNREFTTKKLGFSKTQNNPMYCALSRGKFENMILQTLSNIFFDLSKFSSDILLFTTKEFDFFNLPDSFKTGSSIMPQKKNFDVLELVRGNFSIFLGYQFQVQEVIKNLPSGYNRDFQLTKEPYIKAIKLLLETLSVITLVTENIEVKPQNLGKALSNEIYATDKAYKLVKKGISFRDAYIKVGSSLAKN